MTGSEGITNGSRDVAAITNGKDLELLPPFSNSTRNLPNEVLLMIFKLLDKNHLKSVRCACKFFEPLVSSLLFDKIYISPHRQNLDVFRHITDHSDLCRYPRELVYNVQRFKANIDPQEYFKDLCPQLRSLALGYPHSNIHHVDKEIENLMRMARSTSTDYQHYSNYRVIQRGLETYREKAKEEDHYNNSGQLLACLCIGLVKLSNLDKVEFQSGWKYWQFRSVDWSKGPRDPSLFSCPLARAWSPFHLQPTTPSLNANTVHEFDNVISAFSLTKKPLRVLKSKFEISVPWEKFHSQSSLSRTFLQHGPAAMYHLESLRLGIDKQHYPRGGSDPENAFPGGRTLPVDLLTAALLHMPGLRLLALSGSMIDDGHGLISISDLFQAVRLPALEDVSFRGMLGSAADILAFLRAQPRLRKLDISAVELSEGTWAGLIDEMRRWLLLQSVDLCLPLRQGGGVDLWDEDGWEDEDMADKIEHYILRRGENPLQMSE